MSYLQKRLITLVSPTYYLSFTVFVLYLMNNYLSIFCNTNFSELSDMKKILDNVLLLSCLIFDDLRYNLIKVK